MLAALGAYRFDGVNRLNGVMLLPLAELVLVGLAEETMFGGVIFGVTERSLGSKAAAAMSALVFSLARLPNEGVSLLTFAEIAAYGVSRTVDRFAVYARRAYAPDLPCACFERASRFR